VRPYLKSYLKTNMAKSVPQVAKCMPIKHKTLAEARGTQVQSQTESHSEFKTSPGYMERKEGRKGSGRDRRREVKERKRKSPLDKHHSNRS
jgi:hypothetical protein